MGVVEPLVTLADESQTHVLVAKGLGNNCRTARIQRRSTMVTTLLGTKCHQRLLGWEHQILSGAMANQINDLCIALAS